jgi:glycosyltransferase involved in cell wall biosynthesis
MNRHNAGISKQHRRDGCADRSQKRDIIDQFGDYNNIFVIPNTVSRVEVPSTERDINKVSIFARLQKQKGIEDAIRAFKSVHPRSVAAWPCPLQQVTEWAKAWDNLARAETGVVTNGHAETSGARGGARGTRVRPRFAPQLIEASY